MKNKKIHSLLSSGFTPSLSRWIFFLLILQPSYKVKGLAALWVGIQRRILLGGLVILDDVTDIQRISVFVSNPTTTSQSRIFHFWTKSQFSRPGKVLSDRSSSWFCRGFSSRSPS